jgi:hypothetical protein
MLWSTCKDKYVPSRSKRNSLSTKDVSGQENTYITTTSLYKHLIYVSNLAFIEHHICYGTYEYKNYDEKST